jgi:hypothetical protein
MIKKRHWLGFLSFVCASLSKIAKLAGVSFKAGDVAGLNAARRYLAPIVAIVSYDAIKRPMGNANVFARTRQVSKARRGLAR